MNRKELDNSLRNTVVRLCIIAVIALVRMPAVLATDVTQESFATPEQAVDALIAANRSDSQAELLKILGSQAENLISSGDPVADKDGWKKFVAAYDAAHALESEGDDKKVLIVGKNKWPMPIPLIRQKEGWEFNSAAGVQEVLDRRIGRNELSVIEVCRAYVDAQLKYAAEHVLPNGRHEYAQHFLSHPGKHDGLYWPVSAGQQESPLGPLIASARAEGYDGKTHKHKPFHGYYYKILTGQSAKAHGGAINYIVGGHMTGGFALLAFPAKYGDSGIMTFIVNEDGIVHEKDLGPETDKIATRINQYNPDESWKLP